MNILFFSNDGKLGDAVLHTALVKGIKESYPQANIYCTTAGATTEFWQRDPRIKASWVVWKSSFCQIIRLGLELRKQKLDYIISWDAINVGKIKLLCWLARPKYGTKTFFVKPKEHASIKEQKVLEMLKCYRTDVGYSIIEPKKGKYCWEPNSIYFNIFASIGTRTITVLDTVTILDKLAEKLPYQTVYITYIKQQDHIIAEILTKTCNTKVVAVDCTNNIEKLLSLCINVSVVLTPDTGIVHIISAFNKPIVALFEKGNNLLQTNWAPTSDKYFIVEFFGDNVDREKSIEDTVSKIVKFCY